RICHSVSRRALDGGNRLGEADHGFVDMAHPCTEELGAGSKSCAVEVELPPASGVLLELLEGVGPASVAHESVLVRHHGELEACLEWHGKAICAWKQSGRVGPPSRDSDHAEPCELTPEGDYTVYGDRQARTVNLPQDSELAGTRRRGTRPRAS